MHKHVELFIGRLATDPGLQARFAKQPFEVLRDQFLELTEVEIEALASIDPAAIRAFTAALDARLRKASLSRPTGPTGGHNPTDLVHEPRKETSR